MRKISAKKYARALYYSTQGLSEDQVKFRVENFIKVIVKNKNFKLADKISEEFEKYSKEQVGILDVEVISARPLSGVIKRELEDRIKKTDKKIETVNINNIQDENLIGGIVVKIGDEVLDASLKTKLALLEQDLS